MSFLAFKPRPLESPHAVLFGLSVDAGVSFRSGAAEGPSGIRKFSESIESYSPRADADLEDLELVDLGDFEPEDVPGLVTSVWDGEMRPLIACLGGDHSITPKVVAAIQPGSERLAVVGFDAHLDLREDYPGDHACTYRRIAESGIDVFVFGPRSGAASEWADAPSVLKLCSPKLRIPLDVLRGRDVYVTVDIDVLDPSVAPGTGNPEPGGPGFKELLDAITSFRGLRVVGFDIVEVSPPLDPSGITQIAAAVLVRELVLLFTA